jgi:hypothetical protein
MITHVKSSMRKTGDSESEVKTGPGVGRFIRQRRQTIVLSRTEWSDILFYLLVPVMLLETSEDR